MPNVFQLIDRKTNKPENFAFIDQQICSLLKVPSDPRLYYLGWYDLIGLSAAHGKNWDQIEEGLCLTNDEEDEFSKDYRVILKYLRENFDIRAWYER